MNRSTSSTILLVFFLSLFLLSYPANARNDSSQESFKFEDFKSKADLQKKLHELFPIDTQLPSSNKLQHIDQTLVEQGKAFRSPNLIGNFEAGVYNRGTSSSRNYVIYYKPISSEENKNWKDTNNGWVIKAVYMGGGGLDLDKNKDTLAHAKDYRLLELSVLSTPNDRENNEHILLAKKLLQYKEYLNPPARFDESDWSELFEIHKNSTCLKNFNDSCVLNMATDLLSKDHKRPRLSQMVVLTQLVIQSANEDAAKKLLNIWPSDQDVEEYENNKTDPRQTKPSKKSVRHSVRSFRLLYTKLLFTAGRYIEAKASLIAHKNKTGTDHGVLSILVKKGDLDNAYDLAQELQNWEREPHDPNREVSPGGSCQDIDGRTSKIQATSELAIACSQKGELDKAYEVISLLQDYANNPKFKQKTSCYVNVVNYGYKQAIFSLTEAYALKGNIQKASELLGELLTHLIDKTEAVTVGNKGSFERIAEISMQYGIPYNSERMLSFIVQQDKMEFNAYTYRNYDPVAYIYALNGEYDKAVNRTNNYKVNKDESVLDDFASILSLEPPTENEYKLNTYIWIAQKLAKRGDKQAALFFLKEVEPYLGSRKERYDKHVNKLKDYLTKVEILLEINEKEDAKKSFNEFLELYNKTPKSEYRTGAITTGFYGRIAVLYTEFETIQNVLKWSENLPVMYGNWTYARMSTLLLEQDRLEEFEFLKPIFAKNIAAKQFTGLNLQALKMMETYGYDQYLDFIQMIQSNKQPKDKYFDYKPYSLLKQPFVKQLISQDVPFTTLENAWPQYLEQCKTIEHRNLKTGHDRYRNLDAAEVLAACYISVIEGKHWQERYGDRINKW